ncbi:hypothetical protein scyTo_0011085 [Scyliorhinus torazame]|uniref:CTNNB1 binding N-teminal domain-containing protein n=1 Tax=Scyliorhinus torazame TaxID=75743 RepID=A0A401NGV6_SCYTO|nr:hypothetical protein [Scyliorhinus torazame]
MISFKDEGEQEEKISENTLTERDLADVKSSLVNESETNQNVNPASDPGAIRRSQDNQRIYQDKSRGHIDDVIKQRQDGALAAPFRATGFDTIDQGKLSQACVEPVLLAFLSNFVSGPDYNTQGA